MKTRLMLTCALSFVGGALAVPAAIGSANGAWRPQPSQHMGQVRSSVGARATTHNRARSRIRAGNAQFVVYDTHCKEYSSTTPAPPNGLDDPRFKPCSPTADSFGVAWLTLPTAAQDRAMLVVMSNLRQNHPIISFDQAVPLIHAAVDNA